MQIKPLEVHEDIEETRDFKTEMARAHGPKQSMKQASCVSMPGRLCAGSRVLTCYALQPTPRPPTSLSPSKAAKMETATTAKV